MTEHEYVVVQVWTPYEPASPGLEGRWLDYSRTTAQEAMVRLPSMGERFRAKHWITGEVLSASQLATMAEHPGWFADHAPKEL